MKTKIASENPVETEDERCSICGMLESEHDDEKCREEYEDGAE